MSRVVNVPNPLPDDSSPAALAARQVRILHAISCLTDGLVAADVLPDSVGAQVDDIVNGCDDLEIVTVGENEILCNLCGTVNAADAEECSKCAGTDMSSSSAKRESPDDGE